MSQMIQTVLRDCSFLVYGSANAFIIHRFVQHLFYIEVHYVDDMLHVRTEHPSSRHVPAAAAFAICQIVVNPLVHDPLVSAGGDSLPLSLSFS